MEAIKKYPQIESHDVQNDPSKVIDEYQHRDPDEETLTFAVHQFASEIEVHNNSGYTHHSYSKVENFVHLRSLIQPVPLFFAKT